MEFGNSTKVNNGMFKEGDGATFSTLSTTFLPKYVFDGILWLLVR